MARYRWDKKRQKLVEVTSAAPSSGLQIISDHTDYESMITGERITSRRQHKEHLAMHGCHEVESKPAWMQERDYCRKHGATTEDFTRQREQDTAAKLKALEAKGVSFRYEDFDG